MNIDFEKQGKELILSYAANQRIDELKKNLDEMKEITIKRTFRVTKDDLRETDENDYMDTLRFCIGRIGDEYTEIDTNIIGTHHRFFFSNDIHLQYKYFVAYRGISILRKIDNIIEKDMYIGGRWDENGGMSFEAYKNLIDTFPKTTELDKYADNRISVILKEYFPECDKYEDIYRRFIERKSSKPTPSVSDSFLDIELAQFTVARDELKSMLDSAEGYSENDWQIRIGSIIRLLYPKYIAYKEKVSLKGVDKYDKEPDFLMIDTNGFVDILEIKKADVQILTEQASYRKNYIPVREFSGAIQQIEKYIYCLSTIEKNKEIVKQAFSNMTPQVKEINVLNPQGILLAGRSLGLDDQKKKDFELIKRQYKHIADVMTYDDLLHRLNSIIDALQISTEKKNDTQ